MFKSLRSSSTGKKGQGIVELALVLPVILALSTAAFDIARVRQHQSALTRAAQAGVNHGTKLGIDFMPPDDAAIREKVRESLLPPLRSSDIEDSDIVIERSNIAGQSSVSVKINNSVKPLFFNWPAFARGADAIHDAYPVVGDAVLPMQEFTAGSAALSLTPAWTVEDDGTLITTWDANSKIVGADFGSTVYKTDRRGNYVYDENRQKIPLYDEIVDTRAWWQKKDDEGHLDNHGWTGFNNGERVSRNDTREDPLNISYLIEASTDNPAQIVFMAGPQGNSSQTYDSNNKAQTRLFVDGDPAPTTQGSGAQGSAAEFLAAFIDPVTNCFNIGENDVVILWDFNPVDSQYVRDNPDALDWNDFVMVVTMEGTEGEN
jgi:hypothetical protein